MKKLLSYLLSIAACCYALVLRAQDTSITQLTDERTPGSLITPHHWWYVAGITAVALLILGVLIRRERMPSRQQ